MTSIIVGGGLGLLGSSGTQQNGYGATGKAKIGQGDANAYVNAETGNLVIQSQDEYLASVGISDPVVATYNSLGTGGGYNSDHWQFSFERSLSVPLIPSLHGNVTRTAADGDAQMFTYNSTLGIWQSEDGTGAYDTISYTGSSWVYTQGGTDITETYSSSGQLLSEKDTNGNTLTYSYNSNKQVSSITDSSGQVTYLDYSSNILTDIRVMGLSPGATSGTQTQQLVHVEYAYDSLNRLTSTTVELSTNNSSTTFDSNVYKTTYTYSGLSDEITSVAQSDGTVLNIGYNLVGLLPSVASITDGVGNETKLSYGLLSTQVTDALGNVTTYAYGLNGRLSQVTQPSVSGSTVSASYTYNADNSISQVTDFDGRTTYYTYDSNGNLIETQDAAGNTVTRTYNSANKLLSETRYQTPALGAGLAAATPETTHYVYDANGNLRFIVSAQGDVTEYRYNGQGERITTINYPVATSTGPYTGVYSGPDTVTGAIPSLSDMTSWAAAQDKTKIQRTDTSYDLTGQIQTVTSWNATDANGNGINNGEQSESRYVYNSQGQLLISIDPRATSSVPTSTSAAGQAYVTSYVYDGLGRLLTSTDGTGQVTVTNVYGSVTPSTTGTGAGVLDQSTAADGLLTLTGYNGAGDMEGFTQTGPGVSLGTTYDYYDADNRLVREIDPTGASTYYVYDTVGRLTGVISPDNELTETQYNDDGQVIATIQYANLVTVANPEGDSVSQVRPTASTQDRKTASIYDTAGRLGDFVDADGYVTQYLYDGADNLFSETQYATPLSTIPTNGSSSGVNLVTSPNDRTTRYFYNGDNQLVGTLDADGYLSQVAYDAAGEVIRKTSYATPTNASLRASGTLTQLVPAASTSDETTLNTYDAQGQLAYTVDALGDVTGYQYDTAGNVTQTTRYATPISVSNLPANATAAQVAALVSGSNPANEVTNSFYDADNRVVSTVDALGGYTTYQYNSVGEITQTTQYATPVNLSSRPANPTSAEVPAQATAVTYSVYDSDGRLVYSIDGLGYVTQYAYDNDGRVTQTTRYEVAINLSSLSANPTPGQVENLVSADNSVDNPNEITISVYDADGQLAYSLQDANSLGSEADVTGYQYNTEGQVTQTTRYATQVDITLLEANPTPADVAQYLAANSNSANPPNEVTNSVYDTDGRLVYSIDALGDVTGYQYNAEGQVTQTTRYATPISLSSLPANPTPAQVGALVSSTNTANEVTNSVYDADGNLQSVTDADGYTQSYTYDAFGNKKTYTNQDGNTWTYQYDTLNRLTLQVDPATATYTTSGTGQSVAVIQNSSTDQEAEATGYDTFGNVISIADGYAVSSGGGYAFTGQRATDYFYDELNRQLQTVNAAPSYIYQGQTIAVQSGDAGVAVYNVAGSQSLSTTSFYNSLGQAIAEEDAAGNFTYKLYNALGEVSYEIDGERGITGYTYDAFGNQITETRYAAPLSQSDASTGGSSSLTALEANIRSAMAANPANPSASTVQAAVAAAQAKLTALVSAVLTSGNANNRTITTAYDLLNRKDKVTQPVVNYDLISTSDTATTGATSPTTTYAYDAFGNLTTQSALVNPTTNAWATTYYGYDADGHQTDVVDPMGYYTRNQYDAFGNLSQSDQYSVALSGGSPSSLPVFNSAAFQNTITVSPASLTPDLNGFDRVVDYGYDKLNRQTSETRVGVIYANLGSNQQSVSNTIGNVTTSVGYDGTGNAVTATDAQNNVTTTYYNALGEIIGVRQPGYSVAGVSTLPLTVYQYDLLGDQIGKIAYYSNVAANPSDSGIPQAPNLNSDAVTYTRYDILGRQIETVQEDGSAGNAGYTAVVQDRAYDALGQVTEISQPQSLVTGGSQTQQQIFGYDRDGNQTSEAAQDELSQSTFDTFGEQIVKTEANGAATFHYSYDADGRLWQTDQSGVDMAYEYDLQGNQTAQIVVPLQNVNQQTYSTGTYVAASLSSPSAIASIQGGIETDTTYDADGRSQYQFGAAFVEAQLGGGSLTVKPTSYSGRDRWGNVTLSLDNDGTNDIAYYYNDQNQVIETFVEQLSADVAAPGSTTGSFTVSTNTINPTTLNYYDSRGNQIGTTDADGNTTTYVYNVLGEKTAEWSPEQVDGLAAIYSESTWAYNVLGQQVTATDGDGNVTSSGYDQLNRLLIQTHFPFRGQVRTGGLSVPDQSIHYSYDQAGNRTSMTDGDGDVTRYVFDTRNELVLELSPLTEYNETGDAGFLTQYQYDGLGNKTGEYVDGRQESWTYDGNGRLTAANLTGYDQSAYSYDAWGRLLSITPSSYTAQAGVTGYQDQSYTYYTNGELKTITDNEPNQHANLTTYEYDGDGRQIIDTVEDLSTGLNLENEEIFYGAGGRITEAYDVGKVTQTYAYDANGNRIEVRTTPASAAYGSAVQDDWYEYDAQNRIVVAGGQGTANSNGTVSVTLGGTGTWLGYDDDSDRTLAMTGGETTDYVYNSAGQITQTYNLSSNTLQSSSYDLAGRLISSSSGNTSGAVTQSETYSYDANGYLIYETNIASGNEDVVAYSGNAFSTNTATYGTPESAAAMAGDPGEYNFAGQAQGYVETVYNGENPTNANSINYSVSTNDSYVYVAGGEELYQQSAEFDNNKGSSTSTATYAYDAQGAVVSIANPNSGNSVTQQNFVNDPEGQALQQTENGNALQSFAYVDNSPVWSGGSIGPTTNYNYQPVSAHYPPANPGQYVVVAGDTLQSIAINEYGDASLWYLIADANGLQGDSPSQALQAGLTLTIPNNVTNIHNNINTVAPYNPSAAIGTVTPIPVPPPSSGGCGGIDGVLAEIAVAIVVAVADFYGQEEANELLPLAFGTTATAAAGTAAGVAIGVASAAIGAAVGDAAGQLAGDALGTHQGFSLDELGTSAIEGAVVPSGGADGLGELAHIGSAALANAAGQGINIALGNQRNFSWSSVAGAAVEAGVSDELQDPNSIDAGDVVNTTTGGTLAYSSAVGLVSGASAQGAQVLLSGHGQIQFASIAANSFGQALGSSLAGQLQSTPGETQAAAVATTTAIAPLGGNVGQPFTPLPQIPSYADEGDDVDALIAENAGNTISEDDPVVSGAQQVADRYNQLSASYGDTASLTAASYAITDEDRTGTIIDLTGTAPGEIQENDSLASTPLSISPLTSDDFSGPSLDADALIQDGAELPLNIGNVEGDTENSTIEKFGENSEALANGTEGVEKSLDINKVIAQLNGLKPLEELLEGAKNVLSPIATTLDLAARGSRIAAAPAGEGAAQAAGEASDFALNFAVDELGATVGVGVGAGVAVVIGTLTAAAAPIEAGLLLGAIGGGIAANYLYGASTAPGFLRRYYYSTNGTPSTQLLPPEK